MFPLNGRDNTENEEGFVKDPIVMKRDPLYSCSKEIKNDFVLD